MIWTPDAMDRLERAIAGGDRIQLRRRGAEHVLLPRSLQNDYGGEILVAMHLGTGARVEIPLDEVEAMVVLG